MSVEALPLPEEALHDLHDQVQAKGDPLDAMLPLNKNIGLRMATASNLLVAGWMTTTEAISAQYVLTAPIYTLGGLALSFSGTAIAHYRANSKAERRNAHQLEVRDELGEPIDVFRTGTRRTGHSTLLRWYGADGVPADETPDELDKSQLIDRLKSLLDRVEETPISRMALATSWLESGADTPDLTAYGKVASSRTFVQDIGKKKRLQVLDALPDEPLLLTTPAQCRELVAVLEESTQVDLRQYLSNQIRKHDPDSGIPDLYKEWMETGGDKLHATALTRRIQTELERTLSLNNTPEYIPELDEFGDRRRIRTYPSLTVRRDKVSLLDGYHDLSGTASIRYQGQKPLLNYLGFSDVETMLRALEGPLASSKAATYAKVALLLKLHATEQTFDKAVTVDEDTALDESGELTLLERAINEPPHRRRKVGRGLRKAGLERSLEYTPRHGRLRRLIGALAIATIPVAMAGGAGYFAHKQARDSYTQSIDEFEAKYHIDRYDQGAEGLFQQFRDSRPGLTNAFEDTVFALENAQYDVQSAVIERAKSMGLTDFLVNQLGASPFTSFSSGVPAPAYSYTKMHQNGVGDVDPNTPNDPVYTITPFNGASSAGYWAGEVDDTIDLMAMASYPFTDATVSFSSGDAFRTYPDVDNPAELALPATPPDIDRVLFEVSTKYAYTGAFMPILTQNGTVPVAAQFSFVDVHGDHITDTAEILFDRETNTYLASYREDPSHYAEAPVIFKYWLAASDQVVNARGPLVLPLAAQVDMLSVNATTKEALGLTADATDAEVITANQAKQYRFDPFTSNQVPAVMTGYLNSYKQDITAPLATIGHTLASTPAGNCNTAAATYMLATGGTYEGQNANEVSGFLNGDGNNVLSVLEAHAWITNEDGKIIDSTPTQDAPVVPPATDKLTAENQDTFTNLVSEGWPALALAGIGSILYKRRRIIAEQVQHTRIEAAKNGKHTQRAISALQYAEWQPTTEAAPRHITASLPLDSTFAALEARPVAERTHSLQGLTYAQAKQILADSNVTVSRDIRRAMKSVLRYQVEIATEIPTPPVEIKKPQPLQALKEYIYQRLTRLRYFATTTEDSLTFDDGASDPHSLFAN